MAQNMGVMDLLMEIIQEIKYFYRKSKIKG